MPAIEYQGELVRASRKYLPFQDLGYYTDTEIEVEKTIKAGSLLLFYHNWSLIKFFDKSGKEIPLEYANYVFDVTAYGPLIGRNTLYWEDIYRDTKIPVFVLKSNFSVSAYLVNKDVKVKVYLMGIDFDDHIWDHFFPHLRSSYTSLASLYQFSGFTKGSTHTDYLQTCPYYIYKYSIATEEKIELGEYAIPANYYHEGYKVTNGGHIGGWWYPEDPDYVYQTGAGKGPIYHNGAIDTRNILPIFGEQPYTKYPQELLYGIFYDFPYWEDKGLILSHIDKPIDGTSSSESADAFDVEGSMYTFDYFYDPTSPRRTYNGYVARITGKLYDYKWSFSPAFKIANQVDQLHISGSAGVNGGLSYASVGGSTEELSKMDPRKEPEGSLFWAWPGPSGGLGLIRDKTEKEIAELTKAEKEGALLDDHYASPCIIARGNGENQFVYYIDENDSCIYTKKMYNVASWVYDGAGGINPSVVKILVTDAKSLSVWFDNVTGISYMTYVRYGKNAALKDTMWVAKHVVDDQFVKFKDGNVSKQIKVAGIAIKGRMVALIQKHNTLILKYIDMDYNVGQIFSEDSGETWVDTWRYGS